MKPARVRLTALVVLGLFFACALVQNENSHAWAGSVAALAKNSARPDNNFKVSASLSGPAVKSTLKAPSTPDYLLLKDIAKDQYLPEVEDHFFHDMAYFEHDRAENSDDDLRTLSWINQALVRDKLRAEESAALKQMAASHWQNLSVEDPETYHFLYLSSLAEGTGLREDVSDKTRPAMAYHFQELLKIHPNDPYLLSWKLQFVDEFEDVDDPLRHDQRRASYGALARSAKEVVFPAQMWVRLKLPKDVQEEITLHPWGGKVMTWWGAGQLDASLAVITSQSSYFYPFDYSRPGETQCEKYNCIELARIFMEKPDYVSGYSGYAFLSDGCHSQICSKQMNKVWERLTLLCKTAQCRSDVDTRVKSGYNKNVEWNSKGEPNDLLRAAIAWSALSIERGQFQEWEPLPAQDIGEAIHLVLEQSASP